MSESQQHDGSANDILRLIPLTAVSLIDVSREAGAQAQTLTAQRPEVEYFGDNGSGEQAFDLDQIDVQFYVEHRQRDCWVLGDALARVRDPWAVLQTIAGVLPADGCVVAVIPNAQHWSLQAKLAIGDLRYEQSGLLSREYLRWFTRETMLELFDSAGLELVEGWPRTVEDEFGAGFVQQIGEMAKLAGVDPQGAMNDALPLDYVVRACLKADARADHKRGAQLPVLSKEEFAAQDGYTPKLDTAWAFPVCAFDHLLTGNDRAVFEAVKNNPGIRKVILTRSLPVDLGGVNVHVLPLNSRLGQQALMECRYVFVKHSPTVNAVFPLDSKQHRIINLWHGIALKRIGIASLDNQNVLEWTTREHASCHSVIASSMVDRMAMASAFYPLNFHNIWVTGLPRNDVVLCAEALLPQDFQQQLTDLRQLLGGRRLVLFAPTFRNGQGNSYYQVSDEERQRLADCLFKHGAVLGVREHMADSAQSFSKRLLGEGMPTLDLGRLHFSEIELLYREADMLVTDYSSAFIDFMLTGKPQICFAYDLDRYESVERGLFYPLDMAFPGPICGDFDSFLAALEKGLAGDELEARNLYEHKRRMFFDYVDAGSTTRLLKLITQETGLSL
ncbi:CDP-glycerol glycerophosphotransferase family protein [Pseudomonas abieticivorans]|uniref:CDP-glycerol glycerophosphotransferase family protein n=1 Tax=Pseudomonas abieticivorans TaxID=2931382 RepID=UPI0020C0D2BD|nr:CDP-glycerol glycerophosphotransferase family protein [Pseudomonas sp. PIA16]